MRSQTDTLVSAMLTLARDIHCEDGVATAAITEAATRLLEQADEIARLRLTDAEREAIRFAILSCEADMGTCIEQVNIRTASRHRETLRGLLERL